MSNYQRLHCIHGSTATPENHEDFSFQLFDYTYDPAKQVSVDNANVKSGVDGEGPGIYAFGSMTAGKISAAKQEHADAYSAQNGSVIGFHVDLKDKHGNPIKLINQYKPNHVDVDSWAGAIESFAKIVREKSGYFMGEAEDLIQDFAHKWDSLIEMSADGQNRITPEGQQLWQNIVDKSGPLFDENEANPLKYNSANSFKKDADTYLEYADPMSQMVDEGGAYSVAEYAIESADNLWEVLEKIHSLIACQKLLGGHVRSWNATFQKAVLSMPEADIFKVALVNKGNFYVVFDTQSIVVEAIQTRHLEPEQKRWEQYLFDQFSVYSKPKERAAALQRALADIKMVSSAPLKDHLQKALLSCHTQQDLDNLSTGVVEDVRSEVGATYSQWESREGALLEYMPHLKQEVPVHSVELSQEAFMSNNQALEGAEWSRRYQAYQTGEQLGESLKTFLLGPDSIRPYMEKTSIVALNAPLQLSPACLIVDDAGRAGLRSWVDVAGAHAHVAAEIEQMISKTNHADTSMSMEDFAEKVAKKFPDTGLEVLSDYFVASDAGYLFPQGVTVYDLALMSDARARHEPITHTPLQQALNVKVRLAGVEPALCLNMAQNEVLKKHVTAHVEVANDPNQNTLRQSIMPRQ